MGKETLSQEIYEPKPKLFGDRAERINKENYEAVVKEIINVSGNGFKKIRSTEALKDKEDFGDVDLICLPDRNIDDRWFKEQFGERIHAYRRTGHVHSILFMLHTGKEVQADFIQSRDEADFERKLMYYSKGHISSLIGMMARKLNFQYGTEGFYKRFKDKKGNWHNILITEDLGGGLEILGLDIDAYKNIQVINDIPGYIATSPLFDSGWYESKHMNRRDRESAKRQKQQDYVRNMLVKMNKKRDIDDDDFFLKEKFPQAYAAYLQEAERINKESYRITDIRGGTIMEKFGASEGPLIGKILKFISDEYPESQTITDEISAEIRKKFFNK